MAQRPILCASDLGQSGATALAWAAAWARSTGAPLVLLHVDGAEAEHGWVPEPIRAAAATFLKRLEDRREEHQNTLAANIVGLDIQCDLRIADGRPWEATLAVAKEIDAALIVVGPHQSGLGSTARRIVTHAERPVLVARGQAPENLDGLRYVVGVPLADEAPPLIQHVDGLAAAHGGKLLLGRAIAPWPAVSTLSGAPLEMPPALELEGATRAHLEESFQSLQSPFTIHIAAGDPAAVLCAVATDGDIIAVAAHERGAVERFFLGSVTERLLRHSERPVYVEPA